MADPRNTPLPHMLCRILQALACIARATFLCSLNNWTKHQLHNGRPLEALSDAFIHRLTSVRLSVAYIGPNSRTERPRKTKIGTEVAHVTRDSNTTFKVKGSDVLNNPHAGTGATWRTNAKILSTCRGGGILCRHAHSLSRMQRQGCNERRGGLGPDPLVSHYSLGYYTSE